MQERVIPGNAVTPARSDVETRAVRSAAASPRRGVRTALARVIVLAAALATASAQADRNAGPGIGASEQSLRLLLPFPLTGPIDIQGVERATRAYRAISPYAPQPISEVMAQIVQAAAAARPGTRVVVVRLASARNRLDRGDPDMAADANGSMLLLSHEALVPAASLVASQSRPALSPPTLSQARRLIAPLAAMPLALVRSVRFDPRQLSRLHTRSNGGPQRTTIGSAGARSASRLAAELLRHATGIELLTVGYNGGHAALNALLRSELDLLFAALPLALPYIESGKVPAIGLASGERFALLPQLPTLGELAAPDLVWEGWFALYAGSGIDPRLRKELRQTLREALASGAVRSALLVRGLLPADPDPIRFAQRVAAERHRAAILLVAAE